MAASSGSRFFVNNLPADATEGDLEQIFCEYGEISKIEVKSKENLVDPGEVKRIAFVTLNVDKHQAQQCKCVFFSFDFPERRICGKLSPSPLSL